MESVKKTFAEVDRSFFEAICIVPFAPFSLIFRALNGLSSWSNPQLRRKDSHFFRKAVVPCGLFAFSWPIHWPKTKERAMADGSRRKIGHKKRADCVIFVTFAVGKIEKPMSLPKFIITLDGYLRLGMVGQHKELLQAGDQCIGGGYYQFDFVSNRIVLDRESWDFGRPKWHLVDVLRVSSVYRGLRIVYRYDDGFHDDFNVSDELKIEYYD